MSIYYRSTPGLKMTGPQTNMTRSTGNQIFDCLFDPIQDTILWIMSHSILKERLTKISRSKKHIFVCFTISTPSSVDHLSQRSSHNTGLKDDCDQIYKSMTDRQMTGGWSTQV